LILILYSVPFVSDEITKDDEVGTAIVVYEVQLSVDQRYAVMAAPLADPVTNVIVAIPSPEVATTLVGASGAYGAYGADDTASVAVPLPPAFTARILTKYVEPLVKPDMEIVVDVDAGETAAYALPLLDEYS
jgi:hypothetical protein